MNVAELRPYAFVLAVPDLTRSAAYFRDALGFSLDWTDASDWRLLSRGAVRVMIGHCPNDIPAGETGSHSYFGYVEVDDLDGLHAEFVARGAIVRQPPADMPWGMREMLVATPDGHRLMFGQQMR
ncbi:MAG: VOC family protein [Acidisphaera sp.]|nr:VOC family protein [Acidisphaera sp.]